MRVMCHFASTMAISAGALQDLPLIRVRLTRLERVVFLLSVSRRGRDEGDAWQTLFGKQSCTSEQFFFTTRGYFIAW